jgi:hypothetical protein
VQVSTHDSSTLEITSTIEFADTGNHELSLHFLLPAQMTSHYERTTLFEDLTSRIRFHTPRKHLFAYHLEMSLKSLEEHAFNSFQQKRFEYPACYFARLYGNLLNRRLKQVLTAQQRRDKFLLRRVERLSGELSWFRARVFSRFSANTLTVPESVGSTIRAVDEFISNRIVWVLGRQLKNAHLADVPEVFSALSGLVRSELVHRRQHRYGYEGKVLDTRVTEEVVARQSGLKKFIGMPLFIVTSRKAQERVYRNYFAALAAAVAASWSFLADAQTYRMAQGQDFGFKRTLLMLLFVAAYVMKDRIKENSRDFLSNRFNRRFPDYRSTLSLHNSNGDNRVFGKTEEISWYEPFDEMEDELQTLFTLGQADRLLHDPDRQVLCYRRQIQCTPEHIPPYFGGALKEIVRFDISRLTKALDDSQKYLTVYGTSDQEITEVTATRVYYVDLLLTQVVGQSRMIGHYRLGLKRRSLVSCVEVTAPILLEVDRKHGELMDGVA